MKKICVTLSLVFLLSVIQPLTFAINTPPSSDIIDEERLSFEEIVDRIIQNYDLDSPAKWAGIESATDSNFKTHGFITEKSINALCNDILLVNSVLTNQLKNSLTYYSLMPDVDEKDGIFRWHFYGSNGRSFDGSTTTAKTKFLEHYNNALAISTTSTPGAFMELGRALHYIQDINCPHHALNMVAALTNHSSYESYADSIKNNYIVYSVSSSNYSHYSLYSLSSLFEENATYSRNFGSLADSVILSNQQQATSNVLPNAQIATAGIIYRFLIDIEEI